MATLAERIIKLLEHTPGLTDREITDALENHSAPQQPTNQKCRDLENRGVLERRKRNDGLIGNFIAKQVENVVTAPKVETDHKPPSDNLSEDDVKRFLEKWLITEGWKVQVAWGHERGIDIEASKGSSLWLIEVKGSGSLQPMRVNYFLGALGELLQRMDKPNAIYSIAFPDMQQFRGLWNRLPDLAKSRTGITALFVATDGKVTNL